MRTRAPSQPLRPTQFLRQYLIYAFRREHIVFVKRKKILEKGEGEGERVEMVMEDNESCGSRVVDSAPTNSRQHSKKLEVYNEVLRRLKQSNNVEAQQPAFDDELWAHFSRLPTR